MGLFDLVAGLIDHQLLGSHHVRRGSTLLWDLGYLAGGAAMTVTGAVLLISAGRSPAEAASA